MSNQVDSNIIVPSGLKEAFSLDGLLDGALDPDEMIMSPQITDLIPTAADTHLDGSNGQSNLSQVNADAHATADLTIAEVITVINQHEKDRSDASVQINGVEGKGPVVATEINGNQVDASPNQETLSLRTRNERLVARNRKLIKGFKWLKVKLNKSQRVASNNKVCPYS